jgi:predicted nucleic acid-binding protein
MIFVDSGAWYALLVQDDPDHQKAPAWVATNHERLVLADYVLDETLTLLRARGQKKQANTFGSEIFDLDIAEFTLVTVEDIELVTVEDIEAAWEVFQKFADKDWSFTGCTSKVVIERMGIKTAFAFDQHFRQFGAVTVP